MFLCALYRSGRHVSEQAGLGHELPELLSESGCQQVQSKDYTLELVAGTVGGDTPQGLKSSGFSFQRRR